MCYPDTNFLMVDGFLIKTQTRANQVWQLSPWSLADTCTTLLQELFKTEKIKNKIKKKFPSLKKKKPEQFFLVTDALITES